ncbi:uncharacterized protein RCC_09445 [Ramularia collo-cygni]|uniref:Uncharacterized protein n=1 Tax=Ramularia collo-cygni TaxID=112498 RepID=A0A2D3VHL9_9PEZI|nr:uncharacterized protein RCC_09445 [Ramularia collo-cygni]CZT23731.1 uncharacterized protein RCC_09445 [Ramularia collo-cygni]
MSDPTFLERARAWKFPDWATLIKLDEELLDAWDLDDLVVRAEYKELLSRADEIPLLCQAQYHICLSAVDPYPGARMKRLYQAQSLLRNPNIYAECSHVWDMRGNNDIPDLREAVDDLIAENVESVAERKLEGTRRLEAVGKAKGSKYLEQAWGAFKISQQECDRDKEEQQLKVSWCALEKHEEQGDADDMDNDSGVHTLRALLDAAVNHLAVTDRDSADKVPLRNTGPQPTDSVASKGRKSRSISFPDDPVSEVRLYEVESLYQSSEDEQDDSESCADLDSNVSSRLDSESGSDEEDEDEDEDEDGEFGPWDHQPSMKERSPFRTHPSHLPMSDIGVELSSVRSQCAHLATAAGEAAAASPVNTIYEHPPTQAASPVHPIDEHTPTETTPLTPSDAPEERSTTDRKHGLLSCVRGMMSRFAKSFATRAHVKSKRYRSRHHFKIDRSKAFRRANIHDNGECRTKTHFFRRYAAYDRRISVLGGANHGFGMIL